MHRWQSFMLLAALTALAGCSAATGPVVPVQGIVTCDGKPLTTGTVVFRPDAARGNTGPDAIGSIEENGEFVLATRAGDSTRDGVAPGWYKVGVVAVRPPDPNAMRIGGMPPPATPLIPIKYADAGSSGLSVEVVENPRAGAYDLKLSGEKK
jgi:hypothetical protein